MIFVKVGLIHLLLMTLTVNIFKLLTKGLDGFILFAAIQNAWLVIYLTALLLIDIVKRNN